MLLTLKMTTAQVVETSITVNNNSPIQDYVHQDDQTQYTFDLSIVNRGNGYETRQSSLLYVFVLFFGLDPAQNTIVVYSVLRN